MNSSSLQHKLVGLQKKSESCFSKKKTLEREDIGKRINIIQCFESSRL